MSAYNNVNEAPYYSNISGDYTMYTGTPNFRSHAAPDPTMMSAPSTDKQHGSSPQPTGFGEKMNMRSSISRFGFDDSDKPMPGAKSGNPDKGILHLLAVYADKCSLNGIIFIKSSKYIVVKIIWTILLLAALGIMIFHLYKLGSTYYDYEKQSQLDLKFETLPFPAVTVCNVNAIKHSQLYLASDGIKDLVDQVNPSNLIKEVDNWEPEYEEVTYNYDEDGNRIYDEEEGSVGRRKRSTSNASSNVTVKKRKNGFFDDFNFTDTGSGDTEDFSGDMYANSWEAESEPAAFDYIANRFVDRYSDLNGNVRQQMGHQIQDMLVQCSFAGRKCIQKNFTLVATSTMGNCYTIEYDKFIARSSGPRKGLSLILYLESDEYIPGITNAKGAQIVIHEPGTLPFPDDEGITLSAGMETSVGLRRLSVQRLDAPYGQCTGSGYLQEKYGIKYTRQSCQEICKMDMLLKKCKCYDLTKPIVYTLIKDRSGYKPCQSTDDLYLCMHDNHWNFAESQTKSCECDSPCKEVQYRKTVSSRSWPSEAFGRLIAKTLCKEKNDQLDICPGENLDEKRIRDNFVKVTVYFESLNYESMKEVEAYSEFQFISDIGGTIGLYVGLSVLSMCEVLHLLIAICVYITRGNWRKNN